MTRKPGSHAVQLMNYDSKMRWYVFSNRTEAVIYKTFEKNTFTLVGKIENPVGQKPEKELDSDRPGRGFSSAASGTIHHSLDRSFHHHETIAQRFAKDLALFLAKSKNENRFDELVLVAEPHFLGLLRGELSKNIQDTIHSTIPKEYVHRTESEMKDLVFNYE